MSRNRRPPALRQQLVSSIDETYRTTVTHLLELLLEDTYETIHDSSEVGSSSPEGSQNPSSPPMLSSPVLPSSPMSYNDESDGNDMSSTPVNYSEDGIDHDISADDEAESAILAALARFNAEYMNIRSQLLKQRVLRPNPPVPKLSHLPLLWEYKQNHAKRFRDHVRVSPDTFDGILARIEEHPIFCNESDNPQMPVRDQLAITLYRLGHYGNAASTALVAEWAGVSEGTVLDCTKRVILSLLALHDEVIYWPEEGSELKEKAKAWVEQKAGSPAWRDGCYTTDGSPGGLYTKPSFYGETWFDKSCNYSTNMQV